MPLYYTAWVSMGQPFLGILSGLEVTPNMKNLPAGQERGIKEADISYIENRSTDGHHTEMSFCSR